MRKNYRNYPGHPRTIKLCLLAALLFLPLHYGIAQSLYVNGSGSSPYTLHTEPCAENPKANFEAISQFDAAYYCPSSPPAISYWVMKLTSSLKDVTGNYSVRDINSPLSPEIMANNTVYTCLTQVGSEIGLGAVNHIRFIYDNIAIQPGHDYRVWMRIEIINSYTGHVEASFDEYTNVIKVNTASSPAANAWNHSIMQPSFTKGSTGLISGNFSNGENYFVSSDHMVYNTVYANGQWNIWALDPGFTKAATGATAVNPNNGQVYFVGTDNRVYSCVWANNQWNTWCLDPNFTKAAPGGITVNPNNGEVYVIGTDGRIYNCVWTNNQWNIWAMQPSFTSAAPGAITVNPTNGEVYFIGTDGRVYNCVWTNNQWNIWAMQPSFTSAAPGAITVNPANGEVYIVSTSHMLYNCVWANNQWNIWAIQPGFTNVGTGALAVNGSSGHVYFIGTDNKLYNAVWSNNQWNIWVVDASYNGARLGAIGLGQRITGTQQYDMVYTVDELGKLHYHYWLSCLSHGQRSALNGQQVTGEGRTGVADSRHTYSAANIHRPGDIPGDELNISPNPVTRSATVQYSLAIGTNVQLSLYSVTGVKVRELVAGEAQQKGTHTYTVDKGDLASGVYYLTLQTDNVKKSVKVIIE